MFNPAELPAAARALRLEDLAAGDAVAVEMTIDESDVDAFVALTRDRNPIHLSDSAAQRAGFDGRVVHGMLIASGVSTLVGMLLPGAEATLMSTQFDFVEPVIVRTALTLSARITHVSAAVRAITMAIVMLDAGVLVARGSVRVRVRTGAAPRDTRE